MKLKEILELLSSVDEVVQKKLEVWQEKLPNTLVKLRPVLETILGRLPGSSRSSSKNRSRLFGKSNSAASSALGYACWQSKDEEWKFRDVKRLFSIIDPDYKESGMKAMWYDGYNQNHVRGPKSEFTEEQLKRLKRILQEEKPSEEYTEKEKKISAEIVEAEKELAQVSVELGEKRAEVASLEKELAKAILIKKGKKK